MISRKVAFLPPLGVISRIIRKKVHANSIKVSVDIWYAETLNIRNIEGGSVLPGYVECEYNPTTISTVRVINIDGIDQGVDHPTPIFFIIDIATLERSEPVNYTLLTQAWLFCVLTGDVSFEVFLAGLQLKQSLLGAVGEDALFHEVKQILDTLLDIFQLFLIGNPQRVVGSFTLDQGDGVGGDHLDVLPGKNLLYGMLDNESFEEVFLLSLLGAALTSLAVTTFIIMIGLTVAGGSALADHVRPAVSAEDLGGEKVVGLGFRFCPGSVVVLEGSLNTIKKFFLDDRWNTTFDDHILVLVHTNVLSVVKDRP